MYLFFRNAAGVFLLFHNFVFIKEDTRMSEKEKEIDCCEENVVHENLLTEVRRKLPPEEALYDLAELFKVFGDSTRVRILFVLLEEEVCVCDLSDMLSMTPSAISHQLKILSRAKLIRSRREGKSVFYSLSDDHVRTMLDQGMEHITE